MAPQSEGRTPHTQIRPLGSTTINCGKTQTQKMHKPGGETQIQNEKPRLELLQSLLLNVAGHREGQAMATTLLPQGLQGAQLPLKQSKVG